MRIQLLQSEGRCFVQLDNCCVPFQDERQARDYLDILERRLCAPHVLADARRQGNERRRRS